MEYSVKAHDSESIKCYLFCSQNRKSKRVLIYSHGFLGNALEGSFLLDYFIPEFQILLYDARGCGNSPSTYVTFGLRESIDLSYIVEDLIQKDSEIQLFLWGREMGAVTIIHFIHSLETLIFQRSLHLQISQ